MFLFTRLVNHLSIALSGGRQLSISCLVRSALWHAGRDSNLRLDKLQHRNMDGPAKLNQMAGALWCVEAAGGGTTATVSCQISRLRTRPVPIGLAKWMVSPCGLWWEYSMQHGTAGDWLRNFWFKDNYCFAPCLWVPDFSETTRYQRIPCRKNI